MKINLPTETLPSRSPRALSLSQPKDQASTMQGCPLASPDLSDVAFDELARSAEKCSRTRSAETPRPSPLEGWAAVPFAASPPQQSAPNHLHRVKSEHPAAADALRESPVREQQALKTNVLSLFPDPSSADQTTQPSF